MRAERLEALIWERLEGTISAQDRSTLEAYLAEHDHARLLEAEIGAVAESLASVDEVAPPESLRHRIDRAVSRRSLAPPSWRRFVTHEWSVRVAYLAAGVLIGVVALHLLAPGAVDRLQPSHLTGAMVAGPPAITADLPGGRLVARRDDDRLELRWTVDSSEAGEIRLVPGEAPLRLEGLAHDGIRSSRLGTIDGGVSLQVRGPGVLELSARTAARSWPITITVTSDGAVVFDRAVTPDDL
jgi:hypothetical protein